MKILTGTMVCALALTAVGCSSPEQRPQSDVSSQPAAAQANMSQTTVALEDLKREYPAATMEVDDRTQLPQAIELGPPATRQMGTDARAIAADFLARRGLQLFAIERSADLEIVSEERDPQIDNKSLIRVQQKIDGIPVFGGQLVIAVKTGKEAAVASVTGTLAPSQGIDTTPGLTGPEAVDRATAVHAATWDRLPAAEKIGEPDDPRRTAELLILDPPKVGREGRPALSWLVTIGTFKYFVDADAGTILHSFRALPRIERRTFECDKKPCTLVLTEKKVLATRISADATELHRIAKEVYDYFEKTFGRRGFDDRGGGGTAVTQVESLKLGLRNAKYQPLAQTFLFERGWVGRDVFAHEFTHAILLDKPTLQYTADAGAVSEFLADFFAVMIDLNGPAHPWKIGESVSGLPPGLSLLRDLAVPHGTGFDRTKKFDPVTNGGQPANMTEYVRPTDAICSTVDAHADNGCVHFNGSILSSAALIAINGGSSLAVKPLSPAKVQQIVYWSMFGLTPLTTLDQAAAAQTRKCLEFAQAKRHAVTQADCSELAKSHTAVGL